MNIAKSSQHFDYIYVTFGQKLVAPTLRCSCKLGLLGTPGRKDKVCVLITITAQPVQSVSGKSIPVSWCLEIGHRHWRWLTLLQLSALSPRAIIALASNSHKTRHWQPRPRRPGLATTRRGDCLLPPTGHWMKPELTLYGHEPTLWACQLTED